MRRLLYESLYSISCSVLNNCAISPSDLTIFTFGPIVDIFALNGSTMIQTLQTLRLFTFACLAPHVEEHPCPWFIWELLFREVPVGQLVESLPWVSLSPSSLSTKQI